MADRSGGRSPGRPYTLLSCSMSIDGYIDGSGESRLLLSNDLDFDRVDEVRCGVDAILVGATTVRNDNPRLLIRDVDRRRSRVDRGLPEHPVEGHGHPARPARPRPGTSSPTTAAASWSTPTAESPTR